MVTDYFSQEIGQPKTQNFYNEEVLKQVPNFENVLERARSTATGRIGKELGMSGIPGWITGGTMRMSPIDKLKTVFKTAEGPIGNIVSNVLDRPGTFASSGVPGAQIASSAGMIPGGWNLLRSFAPKLNLPEADIPFGDTTGFSEVMEPSTQEAKTISTLGNLAGMTAGVENPELIAKGFMGGVKGATAPVRGAVGGVNRFFSAKPFREKLTSLPIETGNEIAAVQSEYGLSPYIKGEGKIGKEIATRDLLTKEAKKIKQEYDSKVGLRKEALRSVSGEARQRMNTLKDEIRTSANELAYTGKEEASTALKSKLKEFHEMYDEGLAEAASEGITRGELSEALRNASSRMGLGSRRVLTGDESTLKGLANEILAPKGKNESISKYTARSNTKLRAEDVKAFFRNVRSRMSTTDHPLSEIYNSVGDLVSAKMPKYTALKEEYKPVYDLIRKTKKLMSEGAIRSYTNPTVSPTKLSDAASLEKELGVNITGRATQIASKRAELANEFKLKINDLKELKDKQLEEIYSKLSTSKENQSRLIHEMKKKIDALKSKGESTKNLLESEINKRNFRKTVAYTLASLSGVGAGVIGAIKKLSTS
jgi:hypothetical protein